MLFPSIGPGMFPILGETTVWIFCYDTEGKKYMNEILRACGPIICIVGL